jgi:hypothetical protein
MSKLATQVSQEWSSDMFSSTQACHAPALNHCDLVLFTRDGQCQEYNVDEQAICAVGLARAKSGIFVEAIQYLLVLATPVEVRMFMS